MNEVCTTTVPLLYYYCIRTITVFVLLLHSCVYALASVISVSVDFSVFVSDYCIPNLVLSSLNFVSAF